MAKICSICKQSKPLTEFNRNKRKRDGLQTHCRICSKEKSKGHYNSNQETHKQNTKIHKQKVIKETRQFAYSYLSNHCCIDCQEHDPIVLEFDHVRGEKRNAVSFMISRGCSLAAVKAEIEKCDVRCANCHRRKTAKDLNWYRGIDTGL